MRTWSDRVYKTFETWLRYGLINHILPLQQTMLSVNQSRLIQTHTSFKPSQRNVLIVSLARRMSWPPWGCLIGCRLHFSLTTKSTHWAFYISWQSAITHLSFMRHMSCLISLVAVKKSARSWPGIEYWLSVHPSCWCFEISFLIRNQFSYSRITNSIIPTVFMFSFLSHLDRSNLGKLDSLIRFGKSWRLLTWIKMTPM